MDEVRYGQKDVPGVNPPPARSDPLPPRLVSRHEQCADRLDRLRRQVLAVAEDLERYASDPEGLPMSERKLAWTLRQIVAGERPEAPETGPTAPQTGEQTGVRVETGTETASARVDLVIGLRQRDVPQHPDGPEVAALAEIDRLRTEAAMLRAEREWLADRARRMGIAEAIIAAHGPAHAVSAEAGRLRAKVKHLSARVREWEAVNADLAARCDSGDIPTRLGERYSQAVLREIDRLRADLDRLRTPRIEDGATVHIDDGRYTVVDVDFRGETAVVTLRPTTTGDSDA